MNRIFVTCGCLAFIFLYSCTTSGPSGFFGKKSPHEIYSDKLTAAGLQETSLGKQWFSAAAESIKTPLQVSLPYKETGYFAASRPSAMGISFSAKRGQKVVINIERKPLTGFALYLDFLQPQANASNEVKVLASADTLLSTLAYEIKNNGTYQLRLQPELLKGGEYTLTITTGPSLAFPVAAKASAKIGSFWGADRDNGERKHEGIDIFAPRRTPLVAAAAGTVTRVTENKLGGKVIFLRPDGRDYSLYYAHLDEQIATSGQTVIAGDTIGLVGNTGNAITTVPHLHFGIYTNGGAIDPLPFVDQKIVTPQKIRANTDFLNKLGRTKKEAGLYAGPATTATLISKLPVNTIGQVEAATADWFKIKLPDGTMGYIPSENLQMSSSLKTYNITTSMALLDAPELLAPKIKELKAGDKVELMGKFGDFTLVKKDDLLQGWIKI